ncbi:MAG: 3,4-dihydroxy-2-butanone-4-phosphate synthase, partial [Steroidobacteraceae bacterium]
MESSPGRLQAARHPMSNVLSLPPRSAADEPQSPGASRIEDVAAELAAGRMVIILDDEDRENEGDLIMAAQHATPEAIAFMIRYTSGIICVPLAEEGLARLELPQMVAVNSESHRTAFTVSVDYRTGTTTGVCAADRAATIRALASPHSVAADFARPGHVFPLRPRRGGVLIRAGHTEAAIDLCALAGLEPAGVLCEVMNDDGTMASRPQLEAFARQHHLTIGTIADLIRHRLRHERSIERIADQAVETDLGEFRLYAYRDRVEGFVHVALARGRLDGPETPLVRVHVADTLRDVLGVRGGSRAWTLRAAMERIARAQNGVVVLLREQQSPVDILDALRPLVAHGAGIAAAVGAGDAASRPGGAAPRQNDAALRASDASLRGSAPGDGRPVLRTYGIGAQILKDLGIARMRVLSAPKQMHGISAFGLEIESYVDED